MRLVPSIPLDNSSRAELKIFKALKLCFNEDERWIAYHSLNLEKHISKRIGEIDFLILSPYGLLALEVKGGGVKVQAGQWYTVNNQGTFSIQNPFNQAKTAMFSLQKTLIDRKIITPTTLIGHAVSFPDTGFKVDSVEWSTEQILDKYKISQLETWLVSAFEYFQGKNSNKEGFTLQQIKTIGQFLRPEFEQVAAIFTSTKPQIANTIKLDNEQLAVVSAFEQYPRYICEGAAGTGKTLLAVELVRRLLNDNGNVLFICKSSWLKAYLKSVLQHENLTTSSISSLKQDSRRKFIAQFDVVVVDEAQDLYQDTSLRLLDNVLIGGLKHGHWYFFQDLEHQGAFYSEPSKSSTKNIRTFDYQNTTLTKNYRNTRHILNFVCEKLGVEKNDKVSVAGTKVKEYLSSYAKLEEFTTKIQSLLHEAKHKSSLTFISAKPYSQSIIAKLPSHIQNQIVKLDDYLMNNFPPVKASFCQVENFKGLENDTIVLVDFVKPSSDLSANLIAKYYVAMTRATRKLVCFWHRDEQTLNESSERIIELFDDAEDKTHWEEIKSVCDLINELQLFEELNIPIPICGFELVENQQIQASAELAWPDHKIAIFTPEDEQDLREFRASGWECFMSPIIREQATTLKTKIEKDI